jgi:hypothetical protein
LTLFWLWGLLLLYIGARQALRGRWWASLLVVFAWVAVVVVTPVLTGAVAAPPLEEAIVPGDMMPVDLSGMEGDGGLPLEGRPGEPSFDSDMSLDGVSQPDMDGGAVIEGEPVEGEAEAVTEVEGAAPIRQAGG